MLSFSTRRPSLRIWARTSSNLAAGTRMVSEALVASAPPLTFDATRKPPALCASWVICSSACAGVFTIRPREAVRTSLRSGDEPSISPPLLFPGGGGGDQIVHDDGPVDRSASNNIFRNRSASEVWEDRGLMTLREWLTTCASTYC